MIPSESDKFASSCMVAAAAEAANDEEGAIKPKGKEVLLLLLFRFLRELFGAMPCAIVSNISDSNAGLQ